MTAWRQAIELAIGEKDLAELGAIARSRTEPASRVERARMLLAYREDPSFFAVAQAMGVHHQTVQRCVERALAYGPIAALDDRPRPGKEPTITAEAKAWVVKQLQDLLQPQIYPVYPFDMPTWSCKVLTKSLFEGEIVPKIPPVPSKAPEQGLDLSAM